MTPSLVRPMASTCSGDCGAPECKSLGPWEVSCPPDLKGRIGVWNNRISPRVSELPQVHELDTTISRTR